jgi:hypothetical protein
VIGSVKAIQYPNYFWIYMCDYMVSHKNAMSDFDGDLLFWLMGRAALY